MRVLTLLAHEIRPIFRMKAAVIFAKGAFVNVALQDLTPIPPYRLSNAPARPGYHRDLSRQREFLK